MFLLVLHHVPVERCADILESTSGTRPSDGASEGPGPKSRKKYLQVASTTLLTHYLLGGRDLASFKDFVYSDLHGTVIVHDRYQNYDSFDGISHQLRCQHLLRELEDAAQSYPEAIWPGQIADALRGLIHQANLARDQGLAAVREDLTADDLTLFRRGVAVGLSQVRRVPGPKSKQPPGGRCWNASATAKPTCCGSSPIPPSRPPPTGRTRPAAGQNPAEDQRPALLGETTRDRYAIRGYASTAVKHDIAAFAAIRDALAGNPWMPPIPAAA